MAFNISPNPIALGQVSQDMKAIQNYLRRFGYLSVAVAEDGSLDEPTIDAIKRFQAYTGMPETGMLDAETIKYLQLPRCGNPDIEGRGLLIRFVTSGCSYWAQRRILTFGFENGTVDISGNGSFDAVRRAFGAWQKEAGIDFVEVPIANGPDLKVSWRSGSHGDTSDFDGVGNVLAHAYYPPPCGGRYAGHLHFDEAENWSTNPVGAQIDLETVALHEIGHLLGLAHSKEANSVMFPFYNGVSRNLLPDDINGVRGLYGKRGVPLNVRIRVRGVPGELVAIDNQFVGSRGEYKMIEALQVSLATPVPGISVSYMGHVEGYGDTPFQGESTWCGLPGEGRRLEGFAVKLEGAQAANYDVFYMTHLEGYGDTHLAKNGEFLGTRGERRQLEGVLIRVEPK